MGFFKRLFRDRKREKLLKDYEEGKVLKIEKVEKKQNEKVHNK